MCLIDGLADGRFLADESLLSEEFAVTRREVLTRSLAAAAAVAVGGGALATTSAGAQQPAEPAPTSGDRLVFLGVNGGPVLTPLHLMPALDLIVNGRQYLIDCGGDTARQIVNARMGFGNLHHVFLTHHHLDHVMGWPELIAYGWVHRDPLTRLRLWGPPPMERNHRRMKQMLKVSTDLFENPFPPFAPISSARDVVLPRRGIRKVMENADVVVHATRVYHGPEVPDAYAYRFDVKRTKRSVVFSGDTAGPNRQLVRLAEGADLLVHEVLMGSEIPGIVSGVDRRVRRRFTELLQLSHTDVSVVPRVAKAANVRRLAMCHYGPSYVPQDAFLAAARATAGKIGYAGEIIAPTELDAIAL